jgi:hypothetical protein
LAAPHVAFEFVNRRCLRLPHDVQSYGLMRVAAKAFHFEIAIPGIERVTERGRWLRRTVKAEHATLCGAAIWFYLNFSVSVWLSTA